MTGSILKIYIVPLIFVFLFSTTKAESHDSAFIAYSLNKQTDSISNKQYNLSKQLYKNKEYTKALKYSYRILNRTNDILLKAKTNLLIGNIFNTTNYPEKASTFYNNTLHLLKVETLEGNQQVSDKVKAETYLKLGSLKFKNHKQIDSALYYYEKLINFNSVHEDIISLKAKSYGSLSGIYANLNKHRNLKKAKEYALKSLNLYKNLNDSISLAGVYGNLGNIYAEEENHTEAKKLYLKALEILKSNKSAKSVKYLEPIYDNLAWSLYNLKDYRAYDFLDESVSLRDSIQLKNYQKELKKIDLKYNIDKIRQEEENKRLKAERNTWVIGVVGVIISLLLLYLVNLYKLRQKNLSLKLSRSKLQQQHKLDELRSEAQVKIINATLDGKESERKQISETLHDNVSALLSSANMHILASEKQFNGKLPIELEKTRKIILEASQKIRTLSHNLVSPILLKFGLEYAIKDIAEKYSNSEIKIHVLASDIKRYEQQSEIKIFNIVQELINNLLKHSKAKKAYVIIEGRTNFLSVMVKDNGKGFDKKKIDGGIGLNQIQARIHMMKGSLTIDSTVNHGTKISIDVPIQERK